MTLTSTATPRIVNSEEINEAYNNFSPTFGGKKDDYFGLLYIAKKFGISPEQAAAYISFGGNNYGVDAFYHDVETKSLYLFAFRWSADHMTLKEPLEKLGSEGMYKIFFNPMRSQDDSPMIVALKTCLHQNWKSIDKVFVNYVFNGDPVDAEQSKVLGFLRESVEDKRSFVDSYLSRVNEPDSLHELVFQYVSNEKALGHIASSRETTEYEIEYGNALHVSNNENELKVVFIRLGTLYKMYHDLGERFFEKNIRSGLDDGNMTNTQIKKSLKSVVEGNEPPENFTLYHNGITLTAQNLHST
ncbi:MAG TPA: AIPR family protein, partial [Nitrososphaera sp.]|nr:AIPR family protein [Nitrososphaera sp.]